MFDMWKKQTLEYYASKPVTHKEIEELDFRHESVNEMKSFSTEIFQ